MRIMFVYWILEDGGSVQDILGYARAARELGHEVVLYGPPREGRLPCSLDLTGIDLLAFVLESHLYLHHGSRLNLARLLEAVPRHRRIVIDCDGLYNEPLSIEQDSNCPVTGDNADHVRLCDALGDKIFQPTFHPRRGNVRTFFFHGYDPAWEQPMRFIGKPFSMIYVGNNWFRWPGLCRVLDALAPVRTRLGRLAIVGKGWTRAYWAGKRRPPPEATLPDAEYLAGLEVELLPVVPVYEVIDWMSKGTFNPVIYRPIFDLLGMVTCRTFETPAAGTIPLFTQHPDFVREIYGEQAMPLVLGERGPEQILDLVEHPERYAPVVQGIRRRLAERYSYRVQLKELIALAA